MAKERFELTSGKDLMWTVTDNESGIAIEFREGLFNETQKVNTPDSMQKCDAMKLARIMREIGAWMAVNHSEVVLCEWEDRRSAIWKLSNENYWLAMAAATNSLLLTDMDSGHAACMLYAEVCDWLEMEKSVYLTAAEEENLKGVLSELTDAEAWEVFKILHVYWNYRTEDIDMFQWAMDVTWWPAWLPEELKEKEAAYNIDED
nr:MAG TPA: hypothetical protein [Bacteriophage sp.]